MNNIQQQVHFIGIGGYGMSAIAKVMLEMGYRITGSDVAKNALAQKLENKGATVFIGHRQDHIQGANLVVYSSAVTQDNPELAEAKSQGIPIIHRSEMLARLLNEKKGIAVAGAHGKTTTSSMIALVMELCGQEPTFIIGGEIVNLGTNAQAGKGDYVVAEADESDGTFLQYHPNIAVVTNIEADHLENYQGDFANLLQAYEQFLSQVEQDGVAVLCSDDVYLQELLPKLQIQTVTYGIDNPAEYRAVNVQPGDRRITFEVLHNGESIGMMELSVPGKHNVYNALATLVTCMEAGLTFEQVAQAIRQFSGAKRRFQVIGEVSDVLVVDDYAHHPTEIAATLSAAKATNRRIIGVFQPQRYSRTYFLLDEFSRAFNDADLPIILDIYSPAGEKQIEGVHSEKLVELIRTNSHADVQYIPTKEMVLEYLLTHVRPGDLVITMGAGDVWKIADQLVERLQSR